MSRHQLQKPNNQYPGGKGGSGVFQRIINQMPPHEVFISGFIGGGIITRKKKPAKINMGFDLDSDALENLADCDYPQLLQLLKKDFIIWLGENISSNFYQGLTTLIYLDPPYLMETRKNKSQLYKFEMTQKQHEDLLKLVVQLDCYVMISGYWSSLYEAYLGNWRTIKYMSQTRSGKPALEYLWLNYPQPTRLHDYSFLGKNGTDRQRIQRKAQRWVNRLLKLPTLESAAILDEMDGIQIGDKKIIIKKD